MREAAAIAAPGWQPPPAPDTDERPDILVFLAKNMGMGAPI
jgi:hypothetical protein